jgi:hypothetical protein
MAFGYNQGLLASTGRVEFYIIMAFVSSLVLALCHSRRVKMYIAKHPDRERYVNFMEKLSILMVFGMSWMLFIFGVLKIGVTVA